MLQSVTPHQKLDLAVLRGLHDAGQLATGKCTGQQAGGRRRLAAYGRTDGTVAGAGGDGRSRGRKSLPMSMQNRTKSSITRSRLYLNGSCPAPNSRSRYSRSSPTCPPVAKTSITLLRPGTLNNRHAAQK